jgi:hypothetical protein
MDRGMQLTPVMMIIRTDLYKSGIGLFFVIKTVISGSSIMTIINDRVIDIYAAK